MECSVFKIERSNCERVLHGDFNVDSNKNLPLRKRKLNRLMGLFDLHRLICSPTHVTSSLQTLIDLIFVNNNHRIGESEVLHAGISDHSLVYCIMKAGLQNSIPRRIEYRSFKTYNNTAFVDDISKVPWSVIENVGNIDDAVFSWTTLFNDVAQEHALIKTRRAKGTHVPSMTNELSDLMRDRDYQHRKARGLKSGYHWNMFCKLRNAVPGNIKTSKSTYYVNLINESKGNSSKLWKAVNEVLPDCPSNPITTINHNGMSFISSSGKMLRFARYSSLVIDPILRVIDRSLYCPLLVRFSKEQFTINFLNI